MINLRNIEKHYSGVTALNQVSLDIARGELVVLIGPSGCGKSTLLRTVNRMTEPDAGQIVIDGRNALESDPVLLRRSIGYVIQNVGLFPHMTVRENVAVVLQLLGWDKAKRLRRADEMLELVRLDPHKFGGRYPAQLSGGQQQRVGIARALAADPALLLMDEPFSAVDPITREQLQEELLRIQRDVRKTILFVTHDIDEAIRLADKICLLRDGAVVQYADPDTLLRQPANAFVAQFFGQEPALRRLARYSVADFVRTDAASIAAAVAAHAAGVAGVSLQAGARTALSKLLGGLALLPVLDDAGTVIGQVALGDLTLASSSTDKALAA
ncbi:osmoprotectant transport system ATP-binding protein [Duganella sp. CF402]|uniref:ABC transporter ATP-binding protein n=1 Tax=unclassified Duganella TaxID=2636909 RepID=UPI0008CF5DDE|nr:MULTISPECIES: ABC transporter ATP-binding protein [unclassified Duganella]RZT09151.1 osmoprotectant transport system ATP-binding protein [Duganella sp. BK701]SEL68593.1 osmoprotectant transport system ATP-binding protein [Duganella sp. CF402]